LRVGENNDDLERVSVVCFLRVTANSNNSQ
jgi:hypothetical protein